MGIFIGGAERAQGNVFLNGSAVNGVFINGANRLTGDVAETFTFADAGVTFSVSPSGVVSLSITTGTIQSSTYDDGHDFGPVTSDVTRHNNITVNVPSGFSNSGTVSMELTSVQQAVSIPTVTTTGESNVGTTFVTLNGSVTSDIPILEKGFYHIEGNGFSPNFIANNGLYVFDSVSGTGNYSEITSGLTNETTYSYIAFARNAVGIAYGLVDTFTTTQAPATADWVYSNSGDPEGGTAGTLTCAAYGDWTGAADIQFSGSNPVSASCGSDDELCTITRTRACTQPFTNADQDQVGVCTITMTGSGTPSCSSPTGAVGSTTTRTISSASYVVTTMETETRQVTNDAFEEPIFFTSDNIVVTSCGVTDNGDDGFVNTNFGTATITNLGSISSNTGTNDKLVTVIFTVTGDIPDGFDTETDTTFTFNGLTTQCIQPPIVVEDIQPSFNAFSAQVAVLGGDSGNVGDGDFFTLEGSGGTYVVTAPTGEGGPVFTPAGSNGAGTFTLSGGRSRQHTFRITNTLGTVNYTFDVEASI